MAIWNRVRDELDKAGKVAQDAIDEGRIRLDAFRSRQLADKAAQALGYAVYRARQQGQELDSDGYARLSSTLAAHEADATRQEERLTNIRAARRSAHHRPGAASSADDSPPESAAPSAPPPTPPPTPEPPPAA